MLTKMTANMTVDNVRATIAFYMEVIGFSFTLAVPEGSQTPEFELQDGPPLAFAMLQCSGVELMCQSLASVQKDLPDLEPPVGGGRVMFYCDVDDADATFARVQRLTEIVKEPHDTFYGAREFSIRDPNGIIVSFATRPQQA